MAAVHPANDNVGNEKKAEFATNNRQSGVIVTTELPPDLAKVLNIFDANGDGDLDLDEIAEAGRQYRQSQKDKAMFKKATKILSCILVVYTAALGGMIFAIMDALKDSKNEDGKLTDRSTGKVVQSGSALKTEGGFTFFETILKGDASDLSRVSLVPYQVDEQTYAQGKPVSFSHYSATAGGKNTRVLITFSNGHYVVYESGKRVTPLLTAEKVADNSWRTMALESLQTGHAHRSLEHGGCHFGPYWMSWGGAYCAAKGGIWK